MKYCSMKKSGGATDFSAGPYSGDQCVAGQVKMWIVRFELELFWR